MNGHPLDLRRTAYHESAHAVIYRALGWPLRRVSVADNGSGLCTARHAPFALTPREKAAAAALVAGIEADVPLTGPPSNYWTFREVTRIGLGDIVAVMRLARFPG